MQAAQLGELVAGLATGEAVPVIMFDERNAATAVLLARGAPLPLGGPLRFWSFLSLDCVDQVGASMRLALALQRDAPPVFGQVPAVAYRVSLTCWLDPAAEEDLRWVDVADGNGEIVVHVLEEVPSVVPLALAGLRVVLNEATRASLATRYREGVDFDLGLPWGQLDFAAARREHARAHALPAVFGG